MPAVIIVTAGIASSIEKCVYFGEKYRASIRAHASIIEEERL